MHRFFRGDFFNFEVIRLLGTTRYGGADVAEVLEAVGNIRENDPITWHKAWSEQAKRTEGLAHEAEEHGHRHAAKMALLRASNYTRASAYMMTGQSLGLSDSRVIPILKQSVGLFHRALAFMDNTVHILQIPYQDGVSLPGYLYLPHPSHCIKGRVPLVVNPIGADSIQEEIYHMFPAAGPDLGYAVFTFEGPGQGLTLHEKGISMWPDWEVLSDLVLDYLFKWAEDRNIELDPDRVAVAGASLAGYFALRASAGTRYKACVAIDPVQDLWEFATDHVSPGFLGLWNRGWIPDWVVDKMIILGTRFSFQMRWEIYTTARFLGVTTPTEILRKMKQFTLRTDRGSRLDEVKCPVLVAGAANSLYFDVDKHSLATYERLGAGIKELWVATHPGDILKSSILYIIIKDLK